MGILNELVITLKPGMPGYEEHKYDYINSKVHTYDMDFAFHVFEETGIHISLNKAFTNTKYGDASASSGYYMVDEDGKANGGIMYLTHPPSYYRTGRLVCDLTAYPAYNLYKVPRGVSKEDFIKRLHQHD